MKKTLKSFDVVTIGSTTRDITFCTDELKVIDNPKDLLRQKLAAFEYGAKISVKTIDMNLGGGAANTAISLARLGLKTGVISKVGQDDIGKSILNNLHDEHVGINLMQIDLKEPTAFSFIVACEKTHERTIFTYRGASTKLRLAYADLKNIKTKWFYISALSGKHWLNNLSVVFKKARLNSTKVAWNPGSPQLASGAIKLQKFIQKTEVLILNKDEALELVLSDKGYKHKKRTYLNNIKNLLPLIHTYGAKITVITDGKKGAWSYDGRRSYFTEAKGKKGLDLTGVGDAFGSSFVAGLIRFKSTTKAMKVAAINAGSVCVKKGAQNGLLTWKEMQKKL